MSPAPPPTPPHLSVHRVTSGGGGSGRADPGPGASQYVGVRGDGYGSHAAATTGEEGGGGIVN